MDKQEIDKNDIHPKETDQKQHRKLIAASYEGPIPPPELFARYEDICPGAADRILKMAELEQGNRHYIDRKIVNSQSRDSLFGIICGFIIGMTVILAGLYVTIQGYPWVGGVFELSGLASLVGVFIYGTRGISKESIETNEPKKDL